MKAMLARQRSQRSHSKERDAHTVMNERNWQRDAINILDDIRVRATEQRGARQLMHRRAQ